jgi:hypothetical protein
MLYASSNLKEIDFAASLRRWPVPYQARMEETHRGLSSPLNLSLCILALIVPFPAV